MAMNGLKALSAQQAKPLAPPPDDGGGDADAGMDAAPDAQPEPNEDVPEGFEDIQGALEQVLEQLDAGEVDPVLAQLIDNYDPSSGTPDWAASPESWDVASIAVDPEGDGAELPDPWLAVAHLYVVIGGAINVTPEVEEAMDQGVMGEDLDDAPAGAPGAPPPAPPAAKPPLG